MRDINDIPTHVAIIMDGNGRWAEQRGLPRIEGHWAGTENCRRIIKAASQYGIKYLTLYAFSTENWERPRTEVDGLFQILEEVMEAEVEALHREGVKIRHLGRLDALPKISQQQIQRVVELTKNNAGMNLNLALNYGGRAEIIDAIRQIIADGIPPEGVNQQLISSRLYTRDLPDPDLIIRTAGEMRMSNFLLWQGAYSEYYSSPAFWPDFGEKELKRAFISYSKRERRFGNLKPKREC
jgi:undecaprenyl diphosphate synthase